MLTDVPERKNKKGSKSRALDTGSNHRWSDKQRMEAVQSWILLGNLALTSRILGIPEVTLRVWKASTWWKDLVNELKTQETIQMSGRLKKIVDASLSAVEDRLVNGDVVFDQKTGEVVRKPVSLKDAHRVAVDLSDRQDVLEKRALGEDSSGSVESTDTKLELLAERFADFATRKLGQKLDKERTIEVEDAIYLDKDNEDDF